MRAPEVPLDAALAAFREDANRAFGSNITNAVCDEVAGTKRATRLEGRAGAALFAMEHGLLS
jgi:hypothetical protein